MCSDFPRDISATEVPLACAHHVAQEQATSLTAMLLLDTTTLAHSTPLRSTCKLLRPSNIMFLAAHLLYVMQHATT